ncbi:MAG TPA: DivIVA domain-containing protein [Solirubrobacteraceae bacterium]|nr:DivIVA domain-containing protein [Solirubrobacteraceae bacterium]
MDIDRQAIERRDFPISRRGYDPAAVDAHLRALAGEIEELQRERADGGSEPSLASAAGTQVQSILAAAETAAADIERQAREAAQATREEADRDAAQTRQEAVERAQAHAAAVAEATATLLERVGAMDREAGDLVDRLRAGAERLSGDLSALVANMGELYDAAAGQAGVTRAVATDQAAQPSVPVPSPPASPPSSSPPRAAAPPPLSPPETTAPGVHLDPEAPAPRERIAAGAAPPAQQPANGGEGGDLDSARLVALNMALNGESREDADRYLAENYQLADRGKLIDEVFAAIDT